LSNRRRPTPPHREFGTVHEWLAFGFERKIQVVSSPFVSFDITDIARKVLADGQNNQKPTMTIISAGQPAAAAKPVVGAISLVEIRSM
jgi:hypothetical protein